MTDKMIDNRVKKLMDLDARIDDLKKEADAIRDELKGELSDRGVDEVRTKTFKVSWKDVISSRLDSAALKKGDPVLYARYLKESVSRRFLIGKA